MRQSHVVEVEAAFVQVLVKRGVIRAAKTPKQRRANFGNVDAPLRVFVADAFRGRLRVTAEIRVGRDRRAIGVKRIDIGGHDVVVVAGIALDAVEDRGESERAELFLIRDERLHGQASGRGQRKGPEARVVEGGDVVAGGHVCHDLLEIST